MVEVMKIMAPPSTGPMHALLQSVPLTLQHATIDPRLVTGKMCVQQLEFKRSSFQEQFLSPQS